MNKINLKVINVNNISQIEVLNKINKTLLKSDNPKVLVTPNAGHYRKFTRILHCKTFIKVLIYV